MNRRYLTLGPALFRSLLVIVILLPAIVCQAQTTIAHPPESPKPKPSQERLFFINILKDQKAIWTSPFHVQKSDAKWLLPITLSTAGLIATDRRTSQELVEHGDNVNRLRISRDISRLGSFYVAGGTSAAIYLAGRATHNARARETGLLSAEALIDSGVVVGVLKSVSQRQRPPMDDSSGEFFDGGSSFPSGHTMIAWSLATVIAQEYGHGKPLIQVGAYGAAAAVGLARYTGRNHFLSDVLVGSAMGYGIGRYVYHKHHDSTLDSVSQIENDDFMRSKAFPRIAPIYSPRLHTYGAMLAWNF